MTSETVELVLNAIKKFRFNTVDITGGAPELNPSFRYFVTEARSIGSHVIVRHNLTVMFEPGQTDLPDFFREQIEADFKREMQARYGISFNSLYAITNMPVKRFLDYLRRSGNEEGYRRKLIQAFNPHAVAGLMCRTLW